MRLTATSQPIGHVSAFEPFVQDVPSSIALGAAKLFAHDPYATEQPVVSAFGFPEGHHASRSVCGTGDLYGTSYCPSSYYSAYTSACPSEAGLTAAEQEQSERDSASCAPTPPLSPVRTKTPTTVASPAAAGGDGRVVAATAAAAAAGGAAAEAAGDAAQASAGLGLRGKRARFLRKHGGLGITIPDAGPNIDAEGKPLYIYRHDPYSYAYCVKLVNSSGY
ncbi:hypothetical protein DIPPA_30471 [Diplonema papillatum]|nr:hypothetical protein DIPPA_30471 [Diplonema papillatum]